MTDLASFMATVHGRVQGVFFRAFVNRQARELGLLGYVRNLPDGTVGVRAEGERRQLEKLADYLKVGPRGASVKDVTFIWAEYTGNYTDFNVIF